MPREPKTVDELLEEITCELSPTGRAERVLLGGFTGLYQAADNWCWAAAAATVATYYDRVKVPAGTPVPSVPRAQCGLVDGGYCTGGPACAKHLAGYPNCNRLNDYGRIDFSCHNPDFDRQGFLNRMLARLGRLEVSLPMRASRSHHITLWETAPGTQKVVPSRDYMLQATVDVDQIARLLKDGRLVCFRSKRGGTRHFIIVYGCETYPDVSLLVWDPAKGSEIIEAEQFLHEFGPFTHMIVTRGDWQKQNVS